ncbi:ficolin-1-like [Drosophila willistoni]|uniref:ficolin-1-like n=1 Tax=Drosophila willistoni TaxID=7260 RepID=UPI000C26C9BB|nr:ficolin-1-like [Drosophila willistoni]
MTALSLIVLACLLINSHTSYGERILKKPNEFEMKAASLAPGYKPCPSTIGSSGIYDIKVPELGTFPVSCEADIAGPGWIVVARRTNDERNFYLKWQQYKQGFGNLSGDFFIGLDKLHAITATQNHELYIRLENFDGQIRYARYDQFYIENENMQYQLSKINGFSGDA